MSDFSMSLSDTSAGLSQVGGKGASLARLAAAGLPVPDGFHVTTAAYTQFMAANHLGDEITTAACHRADLAHGQLDLPGDLWAFNCRVVVASP